MDKKEEPIIIEETEEKAKKKFNPVILIVIGVVALILIIIGAIILVAVGLFGFRMVKSNKTTTRSTNVVEVNKYADYQLTGNSIEAFDLYFLQLENNKKNNVYSPLSIKYALEMLNEGTKGNSKKQITNILGTYQNRTYQNSSNMSFANAMFIKESYKKDVRDAYIKTLSTKYNANVVYDSFKKPDALNSWVSEKTFGLIDHLYDDISDEDFILLNALAIDMEWDKKIQSEHEDYYVEFSHEDYGKYVGALDSVDYHQLSFKDVSYKVKSAEIGAVINKYDIYTTIGEESIRKTVKEEYDKWLSSDEGYCGDEITDIDAYLDKYISEIKANYKKISSSTNFEFYVDSNVKVFAKDLKTYNNTTLQYVAIMPTSVSLDSYIKTVKADDINTIINNLKDIKLNNFKDGVVTEISGYIPMFKYDYKLNFIKDLSKLGITDIFDPDKADLSNLTKSKSYINEATHQATIEFSNEGIKAAAVTALGGKGAIDCGFDYKYEVLVEKIDLTFDKPFIYIIRDKSTNEAWFVGSVYEPVKYVEQTIDYE